MTLAQVFYCEFCEISKNTLFHRTPPVAASVKRIQYQVLSLDLKINESQFCGQWIYQKAFLNWFCQYVLLSINNWLSFPNITSIDLKAWGYSTLLISWFINFKDTLKTSDDFKSKQKKCMKQWFLICQNKHILKFCSVLYALR